VDSVFIDSDVCLDLLTDRRPFSLQAAKLFGLSGEGKMLLNTGANTFTNLFYLLRKDAGGSKAAVQLISRLKSLVNVLPVTEKIIDAALSSDFSDFEDAVQYFACLYGGIQTIITRNVKDYKTAACTVLTPDAYLKAFNV
jgi:predicted nucleic acid-binding protein